jgi:hypothetical protein
MEAALRIRVSRACLIHGVAIGRGLEADVYGL